MGPAGPRQDEPVRRPGVAVREYPLETGYADYLLFVNRRAVGVVEAKLEAIWRRL
jgi:type I restriction enzyme R subunit